MGLGGAIAGTVAVLGTVIGTGVIVVQIPEVHDYVFGPTKSEMKRVVTTLDVALGDSQRARTRLVKIVQAVNRCGKWPLTAVTEIRSVTDDRQQGADLVSKIAPANSDSAAQGLLDDYTQVMIRSKAADGAYAAWLASWNTRYLKIKHSGCHIARSGALWADFVDANASATDAKRVFLVGYVPQARKFRLRTWTLTQI